MFCNGRSGIINEVFTYHRWAPPTAHRTRAHPLSAVPHGLRQPLTTIESMDLSWPPSLTPSVAGCSDGSGSMSSSHQGSRCQSQQALEQSAPGVASGEQTDLAQVLT